MKATPRPSGTQAERATMTASPAQTEELQRRQLEKSVAWTGHEWLRLTWYRLRLTVREMNYAVRRLTELQSRLPQRW